MLNQLKKFGEYTTQPELGSICHFVYDAKYKDSLPWWDKFPLCIPADNAAGGFYGWNLHYVSSKMRKYILDNLRDNSKKQMKLDRVRANYKFLKTMSIYDDIKPCIKHYLLNHVESRFLVINQEHWDKIITLPTAQWQNSKPPGINEEGTKAIPTTKILKQSKPKGIPGRPLGSKNKEVK